MVIVGQEWCNAREKCVRAYNIVASIEVTTEAIKQVRLHLDSNQGREITGPLLYRLSHRGETSFDRYVALIKCACRYNVCITWRGILGGILAMISHTDSHID